MYFDQSMAFGGLTSAAICHLASVNGEEKCMCFEACVIRANLGGKREELHIETS